MTGGWIGNNRELVMPLRLLDVNEHVHRIEANIDTGFNGHLTLPPGLPHLLGFISDKPLDLTMANDQTERFPLTEALFFGWATVALSASSSPKAYR